MPAAFPFDSLWTQLRRKTWMWLFRQAQIAQGLKWCGAYAEIRSVNVLEAGVLEVAGATGRSADSHDEPVLRLKLASVDTLHVTSACTCHNGPLCDHAAALLLRLGEPAAQTRVERLAAPGAGRVPEVAAGAGVASSEAERVEAGTPQPWLKLRRVEVERPTGRVVRGSPEFASVRLGVAEMSVLYEACPERLAVPGRGASVRWTDGEGRRLELTRNLHLERLLLADVTLTGLIPLPQAVPGVRGDGPLQALFSVTEKRQALHWAAFVRDHVPQLRGEGWQIDIEPGFGFTIHEAAETDWFTELESAGDGTFDFDLGINLPGQRVSVVPLLAECIEQGLTAKVLEQDPGRSYLIALPGAEQTVLSVPATRLLALVRFLDELLAARPPRRNGRLRIDKLRAAQLAGLEGLPLRLPEELVRLREQLVGFTGLSEVPPPAGLRATLRPYQREGLAWLQFLREFELHGVLADDMGLGKTVQTLAHLLVEKEAGRLDRPCLILAPTSVVRNWAREAAKFTPTLRILLLQGGDRRRGYGTLHRHDLVITSYPLLLRDAAELGSVDWHLAVLDEAQYIKNPRSRAAQICTGLKTRHRLCLTGTPVENHLGELWSLFHFLMPGLLGDAESFRSHYRNPIERDRDAGRQQQLAARLRPLLLRRTKDAVARDLPPKTEILHTIELDPGQAELYETIRATVDERVREAIQAQGLERSQILVLDALLKLRQVCCHPRLLGGEGAASGTASAKTAYLMEDLLPELLEEGRSVLIFSQFTRLLALLGEELRRAGIEHVVLTGDTRDRDTPVQRFQNGEVCVFLISLKAGGSGLNLTAADTVIHYDPWWNPAVEAQASDRAHRIGQTRPVFIHKLICQDTLEERIVDLQKTKAALVEGLLAGRSEGTQLTAEDLRHLLDPVTADG